jgi:hypothetical protein
LRGRAAKCSPGGRAGALRERSRDISRLGCRKFLGTKRPRIRQPNRIERLQIVKDGAALRLHSKNGYEWTKRLASLAEALAGIRSRSAVIDCEQVFSAAEVSTAYSRP